MAVVAAAAQESVCPQPAKLLSTASKSFGHVFIAPATDDIILERRGLCWLKLLVTKSSGNSP
jgi:hypothetical protein